MDVFKNLQNEEVHIARQVNRNISFQICTKHETEGKICEQNRHKRIKSKNMNMYLLHKLDAQILSFIFDGTKR